MPDLACRTVGKILCLTDMLKDSEKTLSRIVKLQRICAAFGLTSINMYGCKAIKF